MISTPRVAIRLASSCHGDDVGNDDFAGRAGLLAAPPPLRFSRSRSRARRTEARRAHPFDGALVVAGHGLDGQAAFAALRRALGAARSPCRAPAASRRRVVVIVGTAVHGRAPGRGAWRAARWISGVAGRSGGRRRAGGRGPPGRAPSRGPAPDAARAPNSGRCSPARAADGRRAAAVAARSPACGRRAAVVARRARAVAARARAGRSWRSRTRPGARRRSGR